MDGIPSQPSPTGHAVVVELVVVVVVRSGQLS